MNDTIFRRFLTAPKGAEVTGLAESPDGKALFVNIQHPGENTARDARRGSTPGGTVRKPLAGQRRAASPPPTARVAPPPGRARPR